MEGRKKKSFKTQPQALKKRQQEGIKSSVFFVLNKAQAKSRKLLVILNRKRHNAGALEKKIEHKTGHSGYCRENSILKFNHIDPNCTQNSLSGWWQRDPERSNFTGRTTMLVPVTRCQQVNADRWLCVWRGNAKEALPHLLSCPGFCSRASFTSRVAKHLFIKYLQTNIYIFSFLRKIRIIL